MLVRWWPGFPTVGKAMQQRGSASGRWDGRNQGAAWVFHAGACFSDWLWLVLLKLTPRA
jgi:hypothetical protein